VLDRGNRWRVVMVFFLAYLVLMTASPIIGILALIKRDYETPLVMVVVFFFSLIGLFCSYGNFVREFSGRYGILWSG
jgi:hypothetical protein